MTFWRIWDAFFFYPNPEHDYESSLWLFVLFNRNKNMILKHSNHASFMIWIESQNKKMAAMTADTDAVGDILFECGMCHVSFKNIPVDEFFFISFHYEFSFISFLPCTHNKLNFRGGERFHVWSSLQKVITLLL
jgi:hypothetical protein